MYYGYKASLNLGGFDMEITNLVEVTRGDLVESFHQGFFVVVDNEGKTIASGGDSGYVTYMRSCAKPMQALPAVEKGITEHYGLTSEEIAILTASHSGEDIHRDVVTSILNKIGLTSEYLQCGIHKPLHRPSAQKLVEQGKNADVLHTSCSGKHVGMLLLCQYFGWPLEDYFLPEHQVQLLMLDYVAQISQMQKEKIILGIDGCGVPVFGMPLYNMALAFANLAKPQFTEGRNRAINKIVEAMTLNPQVVAGTGRFCTDLMAATKGKIVAKDGNEGVFCLGIVDKGWGLAIKVGDGSMRPHGPAILSILEQLNVLNEGELAKLEGYRIPKIRNFRKEVIGEMRSAIKI